MPIISIAGYLIYQTIADVGLIIFKARIRNLEFYFIIMCSDRHAASHPARITAHARGGELYTGGEMPAFRMNGVG